MENNCNHSNINFVRPLDLPSTSSIVKVDGGGEMSQKKRRLDPESDDGERDLD